jgi:hypothetical protein
MPAAGSAPIPLTVKKTAASGEIPVRKHLRTPTAAEIAREPTVQVKVDALPAPEPAPLVPARPAPITAREAPITAREAPQPHAPAPHVHPHPRPHPHPHPHPQTAPTKAPAPVAAHNAPVPASAAPSPPAAHATGDGVPSPAPRPDSKARLKKVAAQVRLTPNTAFDAVEADFFAREADLYKREAVENFDDLDGGADPAKRPGAVRAKKKK